MAGKFVGRTPWAGHQFTAAVGALAVETLVSAGSAECTLEGTNHRFGRFRRKIDVAALAVGPEVEHDT
jgi:hypothetical protein